MAKTAKRTLGNKSGSVPGSVSGALPKALIEQATRAHQAGNLAAAEALYKQIVKGQLGNPKFGAIQNNLGVALKDQGKLDEAIPYLERAIALDPNYADAHSNLGAVLFAQGKRDEAMQSNRRAIACQPNHAGAYCNIGAIFEVQEKLDEAIESYQKAIEVNHYYHKAYNNLGALFKKIGDLEAAVDAYRRAIELKPDAYLAINNLGVALKDQNDLAAALTCHRQAITINPGCSEAHFNMSMANLALGNLKSGWIGYDWRMKAGSTMSAWQPFPIPTWDGSSLAGKSILVRSEQGLGDEIMFANVLPDVIAVSAHCVIECEPRLVGLFANSFPQADIQAKPYLAALRGDVEFDYQIPVASLPRYFRPTIAHFPITDRYLIAENDRKNFWQQRIDAVGPGLKVGIAWRSRLTSGERSPYYAEIQDLGPVFAVEDVTFVNLQYDDCGTEIAEAKERFGATIHTWEDINLMDDISDAAALTSCLDVVISAFTATNAMAGALGVKTYAFGPKLDYWTMLGTDHLPWYPAVEVVQQDQPGEWKGLFEKIAHSISSQGSVEQSDNG